MKPKVRFVLMMLGASLSFSAIACDPETGERRQMIFVEAGGKTVRFWEVVPGEIKALELPTGKTVGLSITPALPKKYLDKTNSGRFTPELVEIRLYDLGGAEPLETHKSWGGANSVQRFEGFTLNLLKPVCYQAELKSVSG